MSKKNKNISKFHHIELANFVSPEVKEVSGKEWVTYGQKNLFFQYLIDRRRGSSTNGAVISSIVDIIYGQGLIATDAASNPLGVAQLMALLKPEDVKRCVNDLKALGQCALQIVYNKTGKNKLVASTSHQPIESIASGKLIDDTKSDFFGEVVEYFIAFDWTKVQSTKDVQQIPAFGTSNEGVELLYIRPYNSGMSHYSVVDYHGALQYAELEEEIANYHVNNIQNGFSPTMFVNFVDGIPEEEVQDEIITGFKSSLQGSSNSGGAAISFHKNKETVPIIDTFELSDAPKQYQFLSDEASRKIITAHRVTSPLLLGLSTSKGFGSNADEMKVASVLFESLVITPFRNLLIENFDKILAVNGIVLDLEFKSLNPFKNIVDQPESETKLKKKKKRFSFSWPKKKRINLNESDVANQLIALGEDEDLVNWKLHSSIPVDYKKEETRDKSLKLVSTGRAIPNASSSQDGENNGSKYMVRYQYNPKSASSNSREFCIKMVQAGKIYRKEDIIRMENVAVNPGWGPNGVDTYSIWLYKGGGDCGHQWFRNIYVQRPGRPKQDVNNPNAETVSTSQARREGFSPERNDPRVSIKPRNMPNNGFLNN